MAELRHHTTTVAAESTSNNVATDLESSEPYNPKDHRERDLKLTCCEKLIILVGALFVVLVMVLVHHPEIYDAELNDNRAGSSLVQGTTNPGNILVTGWATASGTEKYAATKTGYEESYRIDPVSGLTLSSIGLGTYLGDATDEVDLQMEESVYYTVSKGINVVDSAINYRGQRSERAIGISLRKLFAAGTVSREDIFVSTKAGFIPADSQKRLSPQKTVASWSANTPDFPADEVVGGKHCMSPACLNSSMHASRTNLGLHTIDLFYIHNSAEKQLETIDREVYMKRLQAAFEWLETQRTLSYIKYYGLATWTCFTSEPGSSSYLSLADTLALAVAAGGPNHGFRYVQIPLTLTMPTAAVELYQEVDGTKMTLLESAKALNVSVMSSRSVGAARFETLSATEKAYQACTVATGAAPGTPSTVGNEYDTMLRAAVAGSNTKHKDAGMLPLSAPAMSLLVTRSVPGLITALVGMKDSKHIKDNLHSLKYHTMPPEMVACMLKGHESTGSGKGNVNFKVGGGGEGKKKGEGKHRERREEASAAGKRHKKKGQGGDGHLRKGGGKDKGHGKKHHEKESEGGEESS